MSEAAAPAPVEAQPSTATPAPVEGEASAAPAKPVDPMAELDEAIRKAGLKVKVGGKERPVQSMKEALRAMERVGGIEATLAEAAKAKEEAAALRERDMRLKSARTARERVAILREYAGDAFDEAAEEAIIERIEREKQMAGMTPREREMAQQLAERERQVAEYEAQKAKAEEEQRAAQDEAEMAQLREQLAGHVVRTLQTAGLPKTAAPDATRRLAFLMSRAAKLGLDLTPEELTPKVLEHARSDVRSYVSGLRGAPLLEFLGEDVAKAVSQALIERHQGKPAATLPTPQPQSQRQEPETRRSPMAAWNALARGEVK
jgi:hypothetical protein